MEDGSRQMRAPTSPDKEVPLLDVNTDLGHFVRALTQLPPGTTAMAAGTWCTWPEYMKTWGEVVGIPGCSYEQVSVADFAKAIPGGAGQEIGEMFEYAGNPGYDGGNPDVLKAEDLRTVSGQADQLVDAPLHSPGAD